MKPSFQHLGFDSVQASFLCYWVRSPRFGFHWHYHPECEISYVKKGRGTRLVGDHKDEFGPGDLLFLGSDLPHTLISDDHFNESEDDMEVVVIQFPVEIIGQRSIEIVELSSINRLIQGSSRGLCFDTQYVNQLSNIIEELPTLTGFDQYHQLLRLLHELSKSPRKELASKIYSPSRGTKDEDRIKAACSFIHEHYIDNIEISQLAELSHMSEAAFCRFFKKMTGCTAISYINDLRIGKACNMLQEDDATIQEVAYKSGYNSITHFNRSFVKRKNCSPSTFRKTFSKELR